MTKRMVLMLAVVFAFIAIIGGYKFFQIKSAMAQQGSFQPPPEAVTTVVAKQEPWDATLNAIGTVVAVQGVTVSADMPGLVDQILFDSGARVSKGDVLLRLDTKQERAQLAAADAQRDLARLDLDRKTGLLAKQVIPQATYDEVAAVYKQGSSRNERSQVGRQENACLRHLGRLALCRPVLHGVEHELGDDDAQRDGLRSRQLDLAEIERDGSRLLAGLVLHPRELSA